MPVLTDLTAAINTIALSHVEKALIDADLTE